MRMLAAARGWEFLSNLTRNAWPARRFRRQSSFRFREVRLLLNPEYLQDRSVYYRLSVSSGRQFLGRVTEASRPETIRRYSRDEISDVETLERDIAPLLS